MWLWRKHELQSRLHVNMCKHKFSNLTYWFKKMHLKTTILLIANSKSSSHDNWTIHYPIFHEKNGKQHLLKKQLSIIGMIFKLELLDFFSINWLFWHVSTNYQSLVWYMRNMNPWLWLCSQFNHFPSLVLIFNN